MSGIEILFPGNDGSRVCLLSSARGSRERTREAELLQVLSPFTLCTEGLASATPLHSQQDPGNWARCFVVSYMPICREGNGTPLQYSCLANPWTEEPCRLQSMGSHRVGHDWSDLAAAAAAAHAHFTDDKTKAQSPLLVRNNDQNQTLVIVLCISCPLPLH